MRKFILRFLIAWFALAGMPGLASAATITPQVLTAGSPAIAVTMSAAAGGGDVVANVNGGATVVFDNRSGGPITVTLKSYQANLPAGTAKTDLALIIPGGGTGVFPSLNIAAWNNPATNNAEFTYSAVTTLFIGAYRS